MSIPALPVRWIWLAAVMSWAAVGWMLIWARRRGVLDLPGHRRSHRQATPRGGGIGMMLVLLLWLPWIGWGRGLSAAVTCALASVALIGAWDDLAPRGVAVRLLVQLAAVTLAGGALLAGAHDSLWWLLLVVPCGVWSINLHNFMDGIDGLLAGHCLITGLVLAVLADAVGLPSVAALAALLAAVCAGFLGFNWAPARIFMGDAGSGGCGLLVAVLALALVVCKPSLLWAVLALGSSFVVDASLTLLQRMWRGRRWTQAHREHLYQWQVRLGHGHARVTLAYLLWDSLIGGWLVWHRGPVPLGPPACLAVYLLAMLVWLGCKIQSLRQRRQREIS